MKKRHPRLIIGLIIIAALCAILAYSLKYSSLKETNTVETPLTTGTSSLPAANGRLISDVYPLYSKLEWGPEVVETKTIAGKQVSGISVVSQEVDYVTDISKFSVPFRSYFDASLVKRGWKHETSLDADGAGSSQWTYSKDGQYIVLSYHSVSLSKDKNVPFSCPCNMKFEIFSGSAS